MEYKPEDSQTQDGDIPLTLPTLEGNRTFLPSNTSLYVPPEQKPKPTFAEGVAAAFRSSSEIVSAYRAFNLNPLDVDEEDNFDPANWEMFEGIDPIRFPALFKARNRTEQQQIRERLLLQQRDEEIMYNSGWVTNLLGGFAGTLLSPTSLIPVTAIARNASLGAGTLKAIGAGAKGVVQGSVAHEAWQHTFKEGVTLEETALNTFADITMGTLMVGAGYGLGHGFHAGRMWEARRMPILSEKGIDVKPIVEKDGTIVGYDVRSRDGSASAAEVNQARDYVNSMAVQSGLFSVPIFGGWLGKGMSKLNPQWRMQTSPYKTVAAFSEMLAENSILTKGVEEGVAKPVTFEIKMMNTMAENKRFFNIIQGLFYKRNGIDSSNQYEGALKNMVKRHTEDGFVTEQQFGQEVQSVLISGEPSQHAAVNEAVSLVKLVRDPVYARWREAYGLPEDWLPPATAYEYVTRDYNRIELQSRSQDWESMWVSWLREADGIIESYHAPIREAEARIKQMEEAYSANLKGLSDELVAQTTQAIEQAKQELNRMRSSLQDELRSNPELRILIDDCASLSSTEAAQLNELFKPVREAEKEIASVQSLVSDIRNKISKAKQSKLKAKKAKTAQKHAEIERELKAQLEQHEKLLHEAKNRKIEAEEALQQMAYDGKIDKRLYTKIPDSQRVKFRDPSDRLKFREVYADDAARVKAAANFREEILANTPEDIMQQTLYTLMGGRMESPNPTKKRSLMIPDKYLLEYGFLSPDIARTTINYRNTLSRSTFMKQGIDSLTLDGGFEGLAEQLAKEHRLRDQAVNAIKDPKKRAKESAKIGKEYKKALDDMKRAYDRAMGRTSFTKGQRSFVNMARTVSATTRLGATPLTMVTEPFAIVMKHGLWPTLRDGIIPTLLNMENRIKGTGADSPERMSAADLNIALEHVAMGAADRNWNGIAMEQGNVGIVESGLEKLAQHSGNWSFMNYMDNWLQRVTANVVDSKMMRYANKHAKGELSEKETKELLMIGVDPDKWLPRFLEGWKSVGADSNGLGGYHANHTKWTDIDAANTFSRAIRSVVQDTVVRRGLLDVPFLADSLAAQLYFIFKGWSFAALSRFTIPLLQRADAQMLTGAMFMLAAGAFVAPIRRLARGEEAFTDDDSMFWNAMVDGGVFSLIATFVEDANTLFEGQLLKGFQNDKYRNLERMGIVGGVPGGIANDLFSIMTMAATNRWNERDMKKMSRLIPFTQAWYLRKLSNTMVESLQLPATSAQAERMRDL